MEAREKLLEGLYEAYNRRDIAAMVGVLDPQVEWFDLLAGAPIKGREAVGAYWTSQFDLMRTEVAPLTMTTLSDGRIAVHVAQTIRKLEGQIWANERVTHTISFGPDGLITRMDPS